MTRHRKKFKKCFAPDEIVMGEPGAWYSGEIHSKPRHSGYATVDGKPRYRIVAEQKLGRPLKKGENVHHINGNKQDDRPENLEVFPSWHEHLELRHKKE